MSGGHRKLPMLIDVIIRPGKAGSLVTLNFRSDEGPFLFKLPSVESFYLQAFEQIAEEVAGSFRKAEG